MNQLPAKVVELLKEYQSGTMFLAAETQRKASSIIKSDFPYKSYPSAIMAVTPAVSMQDNGAVFYFFLSIHNQFTGKPVFEADTFLNVAADDDLQILRALTVQDVMDFHFYDPNVQYQGSKRIRWNPQTASQIRDMIRQAQEHNAQLSAIDYPVARMALMEQLEK